MKEEWADVKEDSKVRGLGKTIGIITQKNQKELKWHGLIEKQT